MNKNLCIVGAGIAGVTMAHTLHRAGYSIVLIDEPSLSSCSKVAAGLMNPFNFGSRIPLWKVEEVKHCYQELYSYCADILKIDILHERFICKKITELEEALWYEKNLSKINSNESFEILLGNNEVILKGAAYLDFQKYLSASLSFFKSKKLFFLEKFEHENLIYSDNSFRYKDFIFDKIIFAEGWKVNDNKYFEYLPMQSVKGELLQFTSQKSLQKDTVLYSKEYMLPRADDTYSLGATYDRNVLNEKISDQGLKSLRSSLTSFEIKDYEIISHQAGIRPFALDRKAIVGMHPYFKNMYVLNGMGSKGAMYAPWLAQQLMHSIFSGHALDDKIDVKRFQHLYYS